MNKKKRQQKAQNRLVNARRKQQEREVRKIRTAEREDRRWTNTQRQLMQLGAVFHQTEAIIKDSARTVYTVTYQGDTQTFRSRSSIGRWFKRTRHPVDEQEMIWAERHVQWMITNNCDDFGNPWPER